MQVGGAGQGGQRLVRRIAADVRTEIERVARLGQKVQVRAVRVVDKQQNAAAAADR